MSRVYFHSPSGEAELRGAERHHMAWFSTHLTWPIIERFAENRWGERGTPPHLLKIIPRESYLHGTEPEALSRLDAFRTWFNVSMDEKNDHFLIDGKKLRLFPLQLNTLYKMGDDPLKLAARLHAQCEIHTWVDGPNREWLAEIIEYGLQTNIFRPGMDWDEVVALLRSRADEPVVTSYSVCERFPNARVAGWMQRPEIQARLKQEPDDDNEDMLYEEWYSVPDEQRWEMAMARLRTGEAGAGLELKPDDWDEYYFNEGLTLFDVAAHLDKLVDAEREAKKGPQELAAHV
jgi:hypothetical protein